MTAFRFDVNNISIKAYATLREASSKGNDQPIFETVESLVAHKTVPTSAILALYNSLTNEGVKRFTDRTSGAKRLFKALEAIAPEAGAVQEPTSEKPAPEAAPKLAKPPKAPRAEGTGKKGRTKGTGEFAGKMVIALKPINPRRVGTKGFLSYEIIRGVEGGVSYAEYVEKGGRPQDLRWDIERKWAEVK